MSSGSEVAWDKFLKGVCKWRSLCSENTPKNIGIILKALNFKNFRIYWELRIFWKLSHLYRKFDIYHESPPCWVPWARTISPSGRRVWGFTTFSPILSTLSFCKLSPYTQAVNFTNFILYWVSYLLHSLGFSEFPTMMRTSNVTALGILCFYEFCHTLRIWFVFNFSLQLEMLIFTSISSVMGIVIFYSSLWMEIWFFNFTHACPVKISGFIEEKFTCFHKVFFI